MSVLAAWAAGFFDGEGSVHYSNPPQRSPRLILQIDQVNIIPLQKFQSAFGVGNILGPYTAKNPNQKLYNKWSVEGYTKPKIVYDTLKDFLCSEKKEKFEVSFQSYNEWINRLECELGHSMVKFKGNKGGQYCPVCRSKAANNRRVK